MASHVRGRVNLFFPSRKTVGTLFCKLPGGVLAIWLEMSGVAGKIPDSAPKSPMRVKINSLR